MTPSTTYLDTLRSQFDDSIETRRNAWLRCSELGTTPGASALQPCHVAYYQADEVVRSIARRISRAEIILAGMTADHVRVEQLRLAALDRRPKRWPTAAEDLGWKVLQVPVRTGRFEIGAYWDALAVVDGVQHEQCSERAA